MKKKIITIIIIVSVVGLSIYFFNTDKVKTPEEIALIFLEQLLTATPKTQNEIFDQADIESYIETNYAYMATERMMKNLSENRYIIISSDIAIDSNSNVKTENIEITSPQHLDEKVYFNFEGTTKVISIDTGEEFFYPFTGQVGLIKNNGIPKVDTLRFFTIEILDHES